MNCGEKLTSFQNQEFMNKLKEIQKKDDNK